MNSEHDCIFHWRSLRAYIPLWIFLAVISAVAEASKLDRNHQLLIHKIVVSGFFLSVTFAVSRITARAIAAWAARSETSAATMSLFSTIIQAGVITMGALLLLANLGISITPLLTALGVGSVAVALGLQDTLNNLFAGIYIIAAKTVEVGDFIKLDSGQEGIVTDVGWRSTELMDPFNNEIIVPNIKFSQAILTNYHKTQHQLAIEVDINASLGSDLGRVEKAVLEVAWGIQRNFSGAAADFEPQVRFQKFAGSAISVQAVLKAKSIQDRPALIHEFLKRVHDRFKTEDIAFA